jgi:hypothetical protein
MDDTAMTNVIINSLHQSATTRRVAGWALGTRVADM